MINIALINSSSSIQPAFSGHSHWAASLWLRHPCVHAALGSVSSGNRLVTISGERLNEKPIEDDGHLCARIGHGDRTRADDSCKRQRYW
jgi:hypothetical protein